MKKIVLTFITTCLLVIMGTINANAATANINVKASNSNPKVGDTITVTVSFSQPVTTASFNLNYTNSVL